MRKHKVIIGPGMDGRVEGFKIVTKNWERKYGLTPEIVQIIWKDNEPFEPKLKKVTDLIDRFSDAGDTVSLIGSSASGSLMLNAFADRKNKVHKVVNLDGFLRPGNSKGIRSFERRTAASTAFSQSILRFSKLERTLTEADRKKVLTVRPLFGDELVPPDTVTLEGASNKTVPMGEHILSITLAFILYNPVIKFLKEE